MKSVILFSGSVLFSYFISQAQNVGIGTGSPHSSAQLEVSSADKGMLVPRIALTAANVASPVSSPADALLVYNTATAGTGSNAVTPGFYFWKTSTARWTAMGERTEGSVGFGGWGNCSVQNVSEYNPVFPTGLEYGDYFGQSASISGNYAVIGAPGSAIGSNTGQGVAYIYFFNGFTWEFRQKLTAGDGAAMDQFGYSVSISGNYVMVGAPYADNGAAASDRGAAYIFFNNGTSWVQQQKLTVPDASNGDMLGFSVSISATRAVAGASGDDIAFTNEGSAYAFSFNGTTWQQVQKLIDILSPQESYFGYSVAIDNDKIIIGAPKTTGGGVALVFNFNGTSWVLQRRIQETGLVTDDDFGYSVSISGSYAVVGSPGIRASTGQAIGKVFVYFTNGSGSWVLRDQLLSHGGQANNNFGQATAISGEFIVAIAPVCIDLTDISIKLKAFIYRNISGHFQLLEDFSNPAGGTSSFSEIPTGNSTALSGNGRFLVGSSEVLVGGRGSVFFGKIEMF